MLYDVIIRNIVARTAAGLIHIEGLVYDLENAGFVFENVNFENNNGTIITTILTDSDVSSIYNANWDCLLSSDSDETYLIDGIFNFENEVGSQHDYLFEFDYQRIRFKNVQMSENECVRVDSSHTGITSNVFDGGCLFSKDCSFSFEDGTFNDNSGDFILSFSRRR